MAVSGGLGVEAMGGLAGADNEPWPGLAMSRCIGHQGVNRIGIIAEPIMPKAFSIPCICRTFTKASSVVIFKMHPPHSVVFLLFIQIEIQI